MVDVDRRMQIGYSQAHVAALKRLCARANNTPRPLRKGLVSFAELARKAAERLKECGISVEEGLREEEFARIEAEFGFSFPPDLRAVLAESLPVGAGFPDWRSGGSHQIRMRLSIPLAGLSYQVARGKFWWKQWGRRPREVESAARIARQNLRKVPLLVPFYSNFYVPSSPELAGNPVLFVRQNEVFCYAYDLVDFFQRGSTFDELGLGAKKAAVRRLRREKSLNLGSEIDELYCKERADNLSRKNGNLDWWRRISIDEIQRRKSCHSMMASGYSSPASRPPRIPRWIEFWSELVEKKQKSSSGSPEKLFSTSSTVVESGEDVKRRMPQWIENYLGELAAVLRNGGWAEEDISDIIEASSTPSSSVSLDRQAVMEGMVLRAGSMCESLRRAGWSSQDVSEILNFEFHLGDPPRRHAKNLAPEFVERIGKLVALN